MGQPRCPHQEQGADHQPFERNRSTVNPSGVTDIRPTGVPSEGGKQRGDQPLVSEHLAGGRLVSMLEPWCAEYPGFFICYPQHRTVSRSLRALIDTLAALRKTGPV